NVLVPTALVGGQRIPPDHHAWWPAQMFPRDHDLDCGIQWRTPGRVDLGCRVTAENSCATEPQVGGARAQCQVRLQVGRRVDVREQPPVAGTAQYSGRD